MHEISPAAGEAFRVMYREASNRAAELETALRFYADPSLWEATDERGIVRGGGWRAREDSGAVAQAALKGKNADA